MRLAIENYRPFNLIVNTVRKQRALPAYLRYNRESQDKARKHLANQVKEKTRCTTDSWENRVCGYP